MKKFLAIALIAASFAACNDSAKKEETPGTADSLVTDANKMADSAKMMADTANKMMADTTHKMMADTASKMMDKAADKMKDASKTIDKAADKMKEKKP